MGSTHQYHKGALSAGLLGNTLPPKTLRIINDTEILALSGLIVKGPLPSHDLCGLLSGLRSLCHLLSAALQFSLINDLWSYTAPPLRCLVLDQTIHWRATFNPCTVYAFPFSLKAKREYLYFLVRQQHAWGTCIYAVVVVAVRPTKLVLLGSLAVAQRTKHFNFPTVLK